MEPLSFSSGVPNRYRVVGLPDGHTAEIAFKRTRAAEVWKIRLDDKGRFSGGYKSAESALTALAVSQAALIAKLHDSKDEPGGL